MADTATPVIPDWELHHRLARSLEVAHLKVKDMAEVLGYSERSMTDWLSGKTRPRPAILRVWAARCGVPYRWLTEGITTPDHGDHAIMWSGVIPVSDAA